MKRRAGKADQAEFGTEDVEADAASVAWEQTDIFDALAAIGAESPGDSPEV